MLVEEKNDLKEMKKRAPLCQNSFCRITIPILVALLLGFGAFSLIDAYRNTRGKNFVVLEQQGVELQRIAIEPWRDKTAEFTVWHDGHQNPYQIEITGGSARLVSLSGESYGYQRSRESVWIHEAADVYIYEPLKLKLYFE
jgi:hypothetical protein